MEGTGAQIFGVIRHAERADAAFAMTHDGAPRWTQTTDSQLWPFDPPLTDEGMAVASATGDQVKAFAEEAGAKVHIILTSPYTRCIQTASLICSKLKPPARILIDKSLGEIFGPTIMGPNKPHPVVRPAENVLPRQLRRQQFQSGSQHVGTWPTWPEDPRSARQRFANRFLTYLQRSTKTGRNFLLVTHADCVGAALSVMPSHCDCSIEKIDYCGMLLARRVVTGEAAATFSRVSKIPSITPEDEEEITRDYDELGQKDAPDQAWQTQTFGVKLHRADDKKDGFSKRTKALEKNSTMAQDTILYLLGALDAKPLEATWDATHMSDSTLLFNRSGDNETQSSGSRSTHTDASKPRRSAAIGVCQTRGKDGADKGGQGAGQGNSASNMKMSRLHKCKELLEMNSKPQEKASPLPAMDAGKNSLIARRGQAALGSLGPLKLSL